MTMRGRARVARQGAATVDPLAPYRDCVGVRPLDRLTWALGLAQRSINETTPADWESARHEIAAALEAAGQRDESVQSVHVPDVEEARRIQVELAEFFRHLLRGEREIRPQPSSRHPAYRLNLGLGKWERWELGTP